MKAHKKITLALVGLGELFLFSFPVLSLATPPTPSRTEIILDASGSMNEKIGGQTKISSAKSAVAQAAADITSDPTAQIALRIYGATYSNRIEDKPKSCKDSALALPFAANAGEEVKAAVAPVVPKGWTPLAYSLQRAGEDIRTFPKNSTIILVTDGQETCGGDPVQAAKDLVSAYGARVCVIGFGVDPADRSELEAIAKAGNCSYRDVANASDLLGALHEAAQVEIVPPRPPIGEVEGGTPLAGGDTFDAPAPFPPSLLGVPFSVSQPVPDGKARYFRLAGKKGQKIIGTVKTGNHDVILHGDGTYGPPSHAYDFGPSAILEIYKTDKTPVSIRAIHDGNIGLGGAWAGGRFRESVFATLEFPQDDAVIFDVHGSQGFLATTSQFTIDLLNPDGTTEGTGKLAPPTDFILSGDLTPAQKDAMNAAPDAPFGSEQKIALGGHSFADAIPFPRDVLGKVFSLPTHLWGGTYSTYTLEGKKGQAVRVSSHTPEQGVDFTSADAAYRTGEACTGYLTFSMEKVLLDNNGTAQEKSQKHSWLSHPFSRDGSIYLMLGNGICNVPKDTQFSVSLVNPDGTLDASVPATSTPPVPPPAQSSAPVSSGGILQRIMDFFKKIFSFL